MDEKDAKVVMDMLQTLQAKINEGFDRMDKRFDSMDNRFDSIHGDLKETRADFKEHMHTRFDRIDNTLDRISQLAEEEIQREKNRTAQYAEMLEKLKFPE